MTYEEVIQRIDRIEGITTGLVSLADQIQFEHEKFINELKWLRYDLLDYEEQEETEEEPKCYVYFILNEEKTMVKIGVSVNPVQRAKNMQTSTGYELEILRTFEFDNRHEAMKMEHFLHSEMSEWRKRPSKIQKSSEWFDAKIVPFLMKFENVEQLSSYRTATMNYQREALNKIKVC